MVWGKEGHLCSTILESKALVKYSEGGPLNCYSENPIWGAVLHSPLPPRLNMAQGTFSNTSSTNTILQVPNY